MRRFSVLIFFVYIVLGASSILAMDIYDWRATTERMCADAFQVLEKPIKQALAGGRPEKLVVERVKDNESALQTLCSVDDKTAQIITKSIVHSFFMDERLRNPLNLSIESYQELHKKCSVAILKYDPDGKKAKEYNQSRTPRLKHQNAGQQLSEKASHIDNAAEAKKQYEMALKEFQTVLSLEDDDSVPIRDVYREMGVVYFRMSRYDDAIAAWQTGLHYAPDDAQLLNNLSIVQMQLGRFDDAAENAGKALANDPDMPQALNTMGQISVEKKEYEEAVKYFSRALDLEPNKPARYWNAALALEQTKNYDRALEYANKYLSIEKDAASRQRAQAYIKHIKTIMAEQ